MFNFREIRYFDIKGEYTGLTSRAMTAPDGKIRIPLNEEGASGKGQIEEYLRVHNGEGIQHIALAPNDLYASWTRWATTSSPPRPRPIRNCWPNACPATTAVPGHRRTL